MDLRDIRDLKDASINKGKRGIKHIVFGRTGLLLGFILLQVLLLFLGLNVLAKYVYVFFGGYLAFGLVILLIILNHTENPTFQLAWASLVLLFPVVGGLMYLYCELQPGTALLFARITEIDRETVSMLKQEPEVLADLGRKDYRMAQLANYVQKNGYPTYQNTEVKYFPGGEAFFEELLVQLKNAKRFIFLEYFIIAEGLMWGEVLKLLKEKVEEGVEVRVLYDGTNELFNLSYQYPNYLCGMGIRCKVFSPVYPIFSTHYNNRDHRKIVVIDGKVAFTGGINLADEYINAIEKHGHWKDAAIMLKGKAAWSFTLIFLQTWEICTHTDEDYEIFYPWKEQECPVTAKGFVQPYADSPMDEENVGEHVYLHILNNAKKYVYINTPYLIVDDSMLSALRLAAKSGVDIRIITPHRWDKWWVHMTTRSYYRELIKSGVKIYEYTNGFIHSKTFVSDDRTATVGTTNLDFRSLYLHYECGALLYEAKAVMEVKEDFLQTLEICQQVTEKDCKTNIVVHLLQDILRLFAPLM